MIVFAFIFCNSCSADPTVGGKNLTTVLNGTVSGGLYEDSYYGFNNSANPNNVTFDFIPLPANSQIKWAKLYTSVYSGNMQEARDVYVNITFNNNHLASEYLSSVYVYPEGSGNSQGMVINEHCNRVTSDYLMWYDVTNLIKANNLVNIDTTGSYDGRIKFITLIIAYDDGDEDKIRYWVNLGHDTDTNHYPGDYIGTSDFISALPSGSNVNNATLKIIHLSSQDGLYTFNNNFLSNNSPQGSYSGSDTWNVTNNYLSQGINTLTYNRVGSYYKIIFALLTVKYTNPATNKPDLFINNIETPDSPIVKQKYAVKVTINNGGLSDAEYFTVKLVDNNIEVASQIINNLTAGAGAILNFSWTPATSGTHNLKVLIDVLDQVKESNETNNELKTTLSVQKKKPDLVITKFNVPEYPQLKKTHQLKATIKNIGLVNAASFLVKFYDGSAIIFTKTIKSLSVGKTTTINTSWTPKSNGNHKLKVSVDTAKTVDESNETNNQFIKNIMVKQTNIFDVFIISNAPDINVLNTAAKEILSQFPGKVNIQLRNSAQAESMSQDELTEYLENCDIFIGEWITTDTAKILLNILKKNPEISDKKNGVFLILEPPVSTTSSSVELMRYSTINGVQILKNYSNSQLMGYYEKTKQGKSYSSVTTYLKSVNFPDIFNIATLYKDLNDKDNFKNQILWALHLVGLTVTYENPKFSSEKKEYGIYRYRWYTLKEYKSKYFKNSRKGNVGLIESTKYVESQMLQTYYEIIDSLETKGLNVIPVTAYGATSYQLEIMVKSFTNAPDYEHFIANPSKYIVYVDSIVEMPAYGLGGDSFTEVVKFLTALNVPVVRAIHSDVITNEQWELESTGLPTDDGSKWWHMSILEAQGIIEYTFVGGKSIKLDPETGAALVGYDPQEENIEYMTKRVAAWVNLGNMKNADKLISLIYYNYPPGKNNIGSSYLDTITSIYNLLLVLKKEGYTIENIPSDKEELEELMITLGINVANWAPGELEKLADNPNVILYPVSDYLKWFNKLDKLTQLQVVEGPIAYIGELCKKAVKINYTADMAARIDTWYSGVLALVPDNKYIKAKPVLDKISAFLKKYIVSHSSSDYNYYLKYKKQFFALNISGMNGWGEAPGDIMVVEKNGTKYFVIPGMKFGNIFIGPEPQRGWEGDINKLYHSSTVAPPHQYLAYFAFIQEQGTDAMVFMGRHATHEWLPGKELVLSPNDFPSVMVGNTPQIYFYIVDGLAEGIQAKRRGYAVIISHLTPPMTFTSLYGDLGTLATLVDDYDGANSTERKDIIKKIKAIIKSNNYDLGVNISKLKNDQLIEVLDEYLAGLQSTLYPYGLHAIGQKWTDDEIALLVTSIVSVEYKVPDTNSSTTIQDEIAKILYKKSYEKLTAKQKDKVQKKCVEVIKSLIDGNLNTEAKKLTSNPSDELKYSLYLSKYYISAINQSVKNEVSSFLNALNGGYVPPGAGADPVANPDVLPTGTNFFDDQAAEIPTKKAYEYAKTLALLALSDITDDTEKIAMGIWCVETARDNGALVSVVLYLLGMEPDWSDSPSAGVDGQKLKEMPIYVELNNLVRPAGWEKKRIDVTVITSGLFRDLYSRQAQLLDNAFRVALARSYYTIINDKNLKSKYGNQLLSALNPIMEGIGYYGAGYESLNDNYVALHWLEDFEYYMSKKISAEKAGEMAITRIFAPPEGDYGAGISKAVSESWTWKDRMELGEFYLKRMGNMYSHKNWGTSNSLVFSRALSGVGTMYASRNTNLYGVLDNDDFFDYWGGLSMAVEYINGKAPTMNVLDYSNRADPKSLTIEQYINRELTTRNFNPNWINGMMGEDYSGARYMSKFTSNLLGWQMTRPGSIDNWMWNKVVDVYLKDSYNLGVDKWLSSGNNAYAQISMTGTLLTAAFEGYWKTDQSTLNLVANTWARSIIKNGVACCDCSCGNIAMMKWATQYINPDMLAQLNAQLFSATQNMGFAPNSNPNQGGQSGSSGGSSGQGQSAQGTTPGEQSASASTASNGGDNKAHEIKEVNQQNSSQNTGMPIAATIGVILLVCLVAVGYFRGKN